MRGTDLKTRTPHNFVGKNWGCDGDGFLGASNCTSLPKSSDTWQQNLDLNPLKPHVPKHDSPQPQSLQYLSISIINLGVVRKD